MLRESVRRSDLRSAVAQSRDDLSLQPAQQTLRVARRLAGLTGVLPLPDAPVIVLSRRRQRAAPRMKVAGGGQKGVAGQGKEHERRRQWRQR
jgi:hypothetical protein